MGLFDTLRRRRLMRDYGEEVMKVMEPLARASTEGPRPYVAALGTFCASSLEAAAQEGHGYESAVLATNDAQNTAGALLLVAVYQKDHGPTREDCQALAAAATSYGVDLFQAIADFGEYGTRMRRAAELLEKENVDRLLASVFGPGGGEDGGVGE